jgi:CDP-diacylglycerol--serine O-phosphatidyltransferase
VKIIIRQIPNILTLSNLLCGCLAIKFAFEWDLVMASYLVGLAAVFDFLDGFAARLLKVSGEMGKQLDSLADMVSFGVVPGIMAFQLIQISIFTNAVNLESDVYSLRDSLAYFAFLIPVLSAYRLAKFNIDTRQTDQFIGLPTPANALFFGSLVLIFFHENEMQIVGDSLFNKEIYNYEIQGYIFDFLNDINFVQEILIIPNLLVGMVVFFSILLVFELPLFALKFKNFGWADNKIRYVFLTISLALLIIFQVLAIPFIVILYILLSIVNNLIFKP